MSIFPYDINYVQEKLTPPLLRTPIRLDWLKVLERPIQLKYDDIFGLSSFTRGFNKAKWSVVTAYVVGDRVRYGIAIWECLVANTGISPDSDLAKWLLIEPDFVGADERVKYNSGKMLFEYVLNRYLNTTATTIPTIYILTNTIDTNGFYMGSDGDGTYGELGTNTNQNDFLGTAYTLGQKAFTIYVPLALFTSLGNSAANREQVVRNVADKYALSGIQYLVTTY